jgi:hypothetical protein
VSTIRSIITAGAPYFQLAQASILGMGADAVYGGGFSDLAMTMRVLRLPDALASSDELHPLFSFQYRSGPSTWSPILELGITPSGAPGAEAAMFGASIRGEPATMSAGGRWHVVRCDYDYGTGSLFLRLDEVLVGTHVVGITNPCVSPGGQEMRLVMFNGASLISRTSVEARNARAVAVSLPPDAVQHPAVWHFTEGAMTSASPEYAPDEFPGIDLSLQAEIGTASPMFYGDSSGMAEDAMRWNFETEWSHRVRPRTGWARSGIR